MTLKVTMAKHKRKSNRWKSIWLIALGILGFIVLFAALVRGNDVAVLNPKGIIANEQYNLTVFSVAIMMIAGIPTLFLFYYFAWKYREKDGKQHDVAEDSHGPLFVTAMWAIPIVIVIILIFFMWTATHRLDPKKDIVSPNEPITIQVIALRWKWLFLYPDQKIATVNYVQVPEDTPIRFDLTADEAPMNSFWIPHWGGQLYAMTGHKNRLNLMAETTGDYPGKAAEINGRGFASMGFTARASSKADFDAWVKDVQRSENSLSASTYEALVMPSEKNDQAFYSSYDLGLYDKVLMKYNSHSDSHAEDGEAEH